MERTEKTAGMGTKDGTPEPENLIQAMADAMPIGVVVMDEHRAIRHVNQEALDIMGYESSQAILGKDCATLLGCCPVQGPDPAPGQAERVIQTQKGISKTLLTSIRTITLQGSTLILETLTDITGQKLREENLRQSILAAEAASAAKSALLANLSHEIRTPLNSILGMAEVAMERGVILEQRQVLETIQKESNNLLDIVNDALDFSKIEAGKLELDPAPFNLAELLKTIASSTSLRARKKGLGFHSSVTEQVPDWLVGDAVRLRQVLGNLTGNALKFTRAGTIAITVDRESETRDTLTLRFSISDTGIGIQEHRLESIFDSYTQADGDTARMYGGTGLGTSISKRLVEMMGGDIGVNSTAGKGSVFWFTAVFGKTVPGDIPEPEQGADLSGLNVLVVDDDENVRDIICVLLDTLGCTSQGAGGGPDALALMHDAARQKALFDIVLADVTMPDMDGFELAEQIAAGKEFGNPPVVLVTGLKLNESEIEAAGKTISGYIQKPVTMAVLKKTLSGLSRSGPGRPLPEPWELPDGSDPETRLNILLVEDYPTNQQVALHHLKHPGFHVTVAENGQEAVEAVIRERFDLVLMDMKMPVMDGYEAIRRIREHETGVAVPGRHPLVIIAMTAHAMKGDREKCLAAGADDYLPKPLKRRDLLAIISRWAPCFSRTGRPVEPALPDVCANTRMQPMDMGQALEEFCNDKVFLQDVIDGFMSALPGQIRLLWDAVNTTEYTVIAEHAHAIKGGAANLTALPLSLTAGKLETLADGQNRDALKAAMHALEKEHLRLKNYLTTLP